VRQFPVVFFHNLFLKNFCEFSFLPNFCLGFSNCCIKLYYVVAINDLLNFGNSFIPGAGMFTSCSQEVTVIIRNQKRFLLKIWVLPITLQVSFFQY